MNALVIAAADALTRSDDGLSPFPGDTALIAAFDARCQQQHDAFQAAQAVREHADVLASRCPGCVEGGTGEVCDNCWAAGYDVPSRSGLALVAGEASR